MVKETYHTPVMLSESIDALDINPSGIYADVTFGGGGHSRAILDRLAGDGKLFAFDQDPDAENNTPGDSRFRLIRSNFRYLKHFLRYYDAIPVDGILADLGVSSYQFDQAGKGFSIRMKGPLDLRMNPELQVSASDIVHQYDSKRLEKLFKLYGEIHNARFLANLIIQKRQNQKLNTTDAFIDAIDKAIPRKKENQYLAQVFQALRIEVNDELVALQDMLKQTPQVLKPGGRLVVLSYHSLEDRLVKNFIKSGNFSGKLEKDFYGNIMSPFKMISRKPVKASAEEISMNNRARSARLRIAEKQQDNE
jgi:16S rRNA (cytosine1402-N4)-methyltransferase